MTVTFDRPLSPQSAMLYLVIVDENGQVQAAQEFVSYDLIRVDEPEPGAWELLAAFALRNLLRAMGHS